MLTRFIHKAFNLFVRNQMNDIDKYVSTRQPKTTADVERALSEFHCKRQFRLF